jgi:DNA modification methylase
VPNGAVGRPQDERWKPGGPNSRFAKDRIPDNRKSHAGYDGPRPKNNANADASLKARDRKLADYGDGRGPRPKQNESFFDAIGCGELVPMRNKRSVWSIATKPFKEAHFATFPPSLVEPCILAGCPNGGVVLDPFGGAGTVGLVADQLGRNAILIELNPAYAKMAQARIARGRMGPEEKKRATIKSSGKLKRARDLPLFRKRKSVTRDEESVPAPLLLPALR